MVTTNFSSYYLNSKEYKILKAAKNKKKVAYTNDADSLLNAGLMEYLEYDRDEIGQEYPLETYIAITDSGRASLHSISEIKEAKRLSYYALIISIIALIISILKQ